YHKALRQRWAKVVRAGVVVRIEQDKDGRPTGQECRCLRHGVFHDELERFVNRYLEETGQRLRVLTGPPDGRHLTDRLEGQETDAWRGFHEGLDRLIRYLWRHHPEEYDAILGEAHRRDAEYRAAVLDNADSPPARPGDLAARYGERLNAALQEA